MILLFVLLSFFNCISGSAIVLKVDHGGRLGDHIRDYSKAKYFSYKYNLPLYVMNFQYVERFNFWGCEKYNKNLEAQFKKKIVVQVESDIIQNLTDDAVLFECNSDTKTPNIYIYSSENPDFASQLKNLLRPCEPVPLLNLPKDKITVAIHVRKGTGYDGYLSSPQLYSGHEYLVTYEEKASMADEAVCESLWNILGIRGIDFGFPDKFPPDQYYIDQIYKLSDMLGNVPLYVYIFTDHSNPQEIKRVFESFIKRPNIAFDCPQSSRSHDSHVIEDLYNMSRFDCLIRSCSCYGQAAQLMGNHKIVIYPKKVEVFNKILVVTCVGIYHANI